MISILQKLKLRFKSREDFLNEFFANPNHEWIKEDRYLRLSFEEFFQRIPLNLLNDIYQKNRDIWFLKSSGQFSCTFSNEHCPVILIFPDLAKTLSSFNPAEAHAVLAHELGHIYHGHSKKNIDVLKAQIEADDFAIDLGFENELESFLNSCFESVEKRVRLTYLTSKVIA